MLPDLTTLTVDELVAYHAQAYEQDRAHAFDELVRRWRALYPKAIDAAFRGGMASVDARSALGSHLDTLPERTR
jgi:hypothetical protein